MDQKRWQMLDELFNAGLELPPQERTAFWARECGGDEEMFSELRRWHDGYRAGEEIGLLEKAAWSLKIIKAEKADGRERQMEGQMIGHYKLKKRIGGGGMGDVYLADEMKPDYSREVALKLVKDELGDEDKKRFKEEMQILAKVEHENIARMYDGGSENGRLYIAMEYLRNWGSLRAYMNKQVGLPLNQIVNITTQLCDGLDAAHNEGIVHRDLKPENIMVIPDGKIWRAKAIDFGIAALPASTEAETRRPTKGFRGTPNYMSPEQAEGKTRDEIDRRSDIYSLGLVIYEMLTGQIAFEGGVYEIFRKQVEEYPQRPAKLNPKISKAVSDVVMRALEKQPAKRQQNMKQLARELEEAAQQSPATRLDRRQFAVVAGAVALLVLAGVVYRISSFRLNGGPTTALVSSATPAPSPSPPVAPENRLTLSLFAQAKGDKAELVSTETVFRNSAPDDETGGVRIAVEPAQKGYVYILEQDDQGKLNLLHPHPDNPKGKGLLSAGQQQFLPNQQDWFRFMGKPKTDSIYILFAENKGEPLFEAIEAAVERKRSYVAANAKSASELLEALQRRANELSAKPPANMQGLQKIISGKSPLVGVLKLNHQE